MTRHLFGWPTDRIRPVDVSFQRDHCKSPGPFSHCRVRLLKGTQKHPHIPDHPTVILQGILVTINLCELEACDAVRLDAQGLANHAGG